MSQSLAKILVHTVFSTKERRPFLRDPTLRGELHKYLGGILKRLECQPIIVGGVADHVHALCSLSRTCPAAEMVKEMKRGSSVWIKATRPGQADFAWQAGYIKMYRNPSLKLPSCNYEPPAGYEYKWHADWLFTTLPGAEQADVPNERPREDR